MENYRIALLVESTYEYLRVLDFEIGRWKREKAFTRLVTNSLRQYSDGNWGVCVVGSANDGALLAFIGLVLSERTREIFQSGRCSYTSP